MFNQNFRLLPPAIQYKQSMNEISYLTDNIDFFGKDNNNYIYYDLLFILMYLYNMLLYYLKTKFGHNEKSICFDMLSFGIVGICRFCYYFNYWFYCLLCKSFSNHFLRIISSICNNSDNSNYILYYQKMQKR